MLGDAHSTNWAENYQFFLNQNNPTNFERVWKQSYYLYRRIGAISTPAGAVRPGHGFLGHPEAGQGREVRLAEGRVRHRSSRPRTVRRDPGRGDEILTNTVVIHFFPNSWDLYKKVTEKVDGKAVEELYDPNVDNVLEEIAKLAGQFGAARIIIEGHTDSSMKGQVPVDAGQGTVAQPGQRDQGGPGAEVHDLDPNQFNVDGVGWDRPADPNDPDNHAKNRRVEIKVLHGGEAVS